MLTLLKITVKTIQFGVYWWSILMLFPVCLAVSEHVFFSHACSRNSKLELELAQIRADFERLKSQDSTKSERLEELS